MFSVEFWCTGLALSGMAMALASFMLTAAPDVMEENAYRFAIGGVVVGMVIMVVSVVCLYMFG